MAQAAERLYRIVVDAGQANKQLKRIDKNTSVLAKGFSNIQRAATSAFAAFGTISSVAVLVRASDQINLLEGSFEALTGSAERAADMTQRVFDTVADTGASLEDVSSTFQRLTIGFRELGASNEQVEDVANTFIKLGRISGTSMFDTNAALVQFSQGLASGKLQGDELRSIMERLPLITELIAKEFGIVNDNIEVTRGQVKQLGREGKITAQIMGNALLRASDEIAKTFEGLIFTLEQELNSLSSTAKQLFATIADETGLGTATRESVALVNDALKDVLANFKQFSDDIKFLSSVLLPDMKTSLAALTVGIYLFKDAIVAAGLSTSTFSKLLKRFAVTALFIIAVEQIIANWDKIRVLFLYVIPVWLKSLGADFLETMVALQNWSRDTAIAINDWFFGSFDSIVIGLNKLGQLITQGTLGNITIPPLETSSLRLAGDDFNYLTEQAKEWRAEIKQLKIDALVEIGLAPDLETDYSSPLFAGSFVNQDGQKKYLKAVEDIKKKTAELIDPLASVNEQLAIARGLMVDGTLTSAEFEAFEYWRSGAQAAAEAQAKFNDEVRRSLDPMIEYREEVDKLNSAYVDGAIQNTVELGIKIRELRDRLNIGYDESVIVAYNESLAETREQIEKIIDPAYEVNQRLAEVWQQVLNKDISYDNYILLKENLDGTAAAAKDAADAWEAYVERTRRALDPTIALNEELAKIDRLWAEGETNFVEDAILRKDAMARLGNQAEETGTKLKTMKESLAEAGNAFIEGFSTGIADALLDTEKSFSEMAESILEDLARMILRAVLFQSIMQAFSGTPFGDFLGVGVNTSSAGVNTFGATPRVGGGDSTHNVGVMKAPSYGKGALSGGASDVQITVNNNAPVDVETNSRQNANGGIDIDMIITQKVNKAISNGSMDNAMKSSFGLARRAY